MDMFLKRVVLKNYKSIAYCDVELPQLCFLVGRNGVGKSNFIDALRLTSDSLSTSLDHALRDRSGINEVRRRSAGHPTHFTIRLEFNLSKNQQYGVYVFRVSSQSKGGFEVQQELCHIIDKNKGIIYYKVVSGVVQSSSISVPPNAKSDRLYLVNLSGYEEFRPLYDSLSRMGFYNLNPDSIRAEQLPDVGLVLNRDGSNIASVLDRMEKNAPESKKKVETFLSKIVPDIQGVAPRTLFSKETIEFLQTTKGSQSPWHFLATNMSDGTLRALGILVAIFQHASIKENPTPFIGIEEPESALHPAASGVLLDALRLASEYSQILVTSHSPDLLDNKDIDADSLLAVTNDQGVTHIVKIDEASRSVIRDGLYTAGELLRINQIEPDKERIRQLQAKQSNLFSMAEV